MTPQQPANYHHNANCTWLINAQPNRIVDLKLVIFSYFRAFSTKIKFPLNSLNGLVQSYIIRTFNVPFQVEYWVLSTCMNFCFEEN